MKKLLNEWRQFLQEEEVRYDGILMLKPDPSDFSEIKIFQSMLPEEAVRLEEKDFHVTMIHQSILKPFKDKLKNTVLPEPPQIALDDEVWERDSLGKKSWAVKLSNQDEMRNYVQQVMELLGSQNTNPEPERIFHISLANLTGNPRDSVR
jgi:hypothetical protein